MRLTVALDGARRRDLTLYPGDEVSFDVVVYEHDGDAVPLDASLVANARFLTLDGAGVPLAAGAQFAVSDRAGGRTRYRLVAEVDGDTTTLAEGLVILRGLSCLPWWCCGWTVLVPAVPITSGDALLLETGDTLVTEGGDELLLEA